MESTTFNIPREETLQKIASSLQLIAVNQASEKIVANDWSTVQQIIRSGMAPEVFPVGAQLKLEHATHGTIIMDVITHAYDKNQKGEFEHSMTLLSHDLVLNSIQFDNTEALYYCETELAAGTYNFTLPAEYDTAHGGGKTYQFTLANAVPAGGVIMYPWNWNVRASEVKVSTYKTNADTVAIETVSVAEGNAGTSLGTADGKTTNMNQIQRVRFGSNNWKESAIRQALNSDKEKGTYWKPQTKFDRPPSWNTTLDGFMKGCPAEFLAICKAVSHKCKTNNVYEVSDTLSNTYECVDTFYFPSYSEIFGGSENNIVDGEQYKYFKNAVNVDRIKYNSARAAYTWWLRSCTPHGAGTVRSVGSDGTLNNYTAYNACGAAVACTLH